MTSIIAHLGSSSEAPANTIASLQHALKIGVDAIEIDVQLSADGHLVVIHDPVIGRTAWGAAGKRVCEMTLEEIKKLDAGSWFGKPFAGERIPTLAEILQIPRGNTGLMIEIKCADSPIEPIVAALISYMNQAPEQKKNCLIGSFSAPLLEHLQLLAPEFGLIGIVNRLEQMAAFESLHLKHWAIWFKLLSPFLVDQLHEKKQSIWAFTVNDLKTARFLQFIGVDGLLTDTPHELKT